MHTKSSNPPSNVLVPCPIIRFGLRRARNCVGCLHYQGPVEIAKQLEGQPELPWSARYRILCAHPIARRTTQIEETEE